MSTFHRVVVVRQPRWKRLQHQLRLLSVQLVCASKETSQLNKMGEADAFSVDELAARYVDEGSIAKVEDLFAAAVASVGKAASVLAPLLMEPVVPVATVVFPELDGDGPSKSSASMVADGVVVALWLLEPVVPFAIAVVPTSLAVEGDGTSNSSASVVVCGVVVAMLLLEPVVPLSAAVVIWALVIGAGVNNNKSSEDGVLVARSNKDVSTASDLLVRGGT